MRGLGRGSPSPALLGKVAEGRMGCGSLPRGRPDCTTVTARELTRKAAVGEFSLGPMLMALIGSRKRDNKRA